MEIILSAGIIIISLIVEANKKRKANRYAEMVVRRH